jgi:hypothetical protein
VQDSEMDEEVILERQRARMKKAETNFEADNRNPSSCKSRYLSILGASSFSREVVNESYVLGRFLE